MVLPMLSSNPISKSADPKRPLMYMVHLVLGYPSLVIQSVILLSLMATVNLPLPLLNKLAIDHMIPAGDQLSLLSLGLLAFLVRAVASGFQVLQNHVMWQLLGGITHRLREGMTEAILNAPAPMAEDGLLADHVGRISSDMTSLERTIFDSFRFIVRPIAMITVMLAVMVFISWPVTLMILVLTPISVFALRSMTAQLRAENKKVLEIREKMLSTVSEQLENIRVLRANNKEEFSRQNIDEQAKRYSEASVSYATRQQRVQSFGDVLNFIPWLALATFGAHLVHIGHLSAGDYLMFIAFDQLLRSPVGQLCFYLLQLKAEMVAPERIEEVLALPKEDGAVDEPSESEMVGGLSIRGVSFAYVKDRPIFDALNLEVEAGQRVAIVGPSGAGKTTLFSLMLGFHRPQSGSIHYGNREMKEGNLRWVRKHLGVVFQHNPMFDASIKENLILDRSHLGEAELWEALERADLRPFVESLPNGLDTAIGVRGLKLSGGQRQRLAIARAMLGDPKIILLDEATSSLDSVSENEIRRALVELLKGKTSLTIAHRLSTILDSDRILYLDGGKVKEEGSFEELMDLDGSFAHLYRLQMEGLKETSVYG